MAAINLDDLVRFAKAYASLGDSVAAQFEDVLRGRGDDCNPKEVIRDRVMPVLRSI